MKRSLQELERGVDLMKAYTRPDQGKITLGFIYTMGYTLVPEMITQFQAIDGNGGITFDFHQGTTAALIKELKEEKSMPLSVLPLKTNRTSFFIPWPKKNWS